MTTSNARALRRGPDPGVDSRNARLGDVSLRPSSRGRPKGAGGRVRTFVHDGVVDRLKREAAEFNEEVEPDELASALEEPDGARPSDRGARRPARAGPGLGGARPRAVSQAMRHLSRRHGQRRRRSGAEGRERHADPAPRLHPRDLQGRTRSASSSTRRIMLGVPGTPMPSSPHFKPAEVGDLINYIQSLSDRLDAGKVEHRRTRLIARTRLGAAARGDPRLRVEPIRRPRSSSARSGGATAPIPTCTCRRCTTARRWRSA